MAARPLLMIVLGFLALAAAAQAGGNVERAKAALDQSTLEFFQREIKDSYPDHVTAYAIVQATVTSTGSVGYCPLRTSQCGLNPTCNHPNKTIVTAISLKVDKVLYRTGEAKLPAEFKNYISRVPMAVKAGDEVQASLYCYKATASMISLVRRAPARRPASAPASGPATRPAATSQPVTVVVKETRKKEDAASVIREDAVTVILVTSPSGIGSMTLVNQGGDWPANLRVRLQYGQGRPYRRLEGFSATISRGDKNDAANVGHSVVQSPGGVSVELALPEGKGPRELKISWIDAYRG